MDKEPDISPAGKGRWPFAAVVLVLLSCYLTFETTAYLIAVFRIVPGEWDLGSAMFLTFQVWPTLILPVLIIWAHLKKRPILFRRILAWVFRVIYVMVILALCDCYSICARGTAVFAVRTGYSKGGFQGFTGPGYYIFHNYGSDDHPGLTIEFWHVPFAIDLRSKQRLLHWGLFYDD